MLLRRAGLTASAGLFVHLTAAQYSAIHMREIRDRRQIKNTHY